MIVPEVPLCLTNSMLYLSFGDLIIDNSFLLGDRVLDTSCMVGLSQGISLGCRSPVTQRREGIKLGIV